MTSPDLTYSDTEAALRDSVRSLLAPRCGPAQLGAMYDGETAITSELWKTACQSMELSGIGLPDEVGGGGAASREVAVVMEELGRSLAPIPFLTSSVIGARVLAVCDSKDRLRSLADGGAIAVLATPWSNGRLDESALPTADRDSNLTGRIRAVADARLATTLLVPSNRHGELVLLAVDATSTGVSISTGNSLDMTRPLSTIELTDVPSIELAAGQQARDAVDAALLLGAAMLASEQLGIANWCLESTVAYVKQRHQFGRSIGSFQAIKHRLARLWISVESARAAARNAAVAVDSIASPHLAVAIAQSCCSDVAVAAAEEAVQLHGGIGMTWEHDTHLYLKRAKADQIALGTPAHHRSVAAGLAGL